MVRIRILDYLQQLPKSMPNGTLYRLLEKADRGYVQYFYGRGQSNGTYDELIYMLNDQPEGVIFDYCRSFIETHAQQLAPYF